MNTLKIMCVGVLMSVMPAIAFADTSSSDLHIAQDGTVSGTNIVVMQKSGTSNFFTRAVWGSAFVRVTVLAHSDTIVTREHGESATSDTVQAGDLIDFDGTLAAGDSLVVNAAHIRDHSLLQAQKTISGTIQKLNTAQDSFILPNNSFGQTTVVVPGGLSIQKGARTIGFGDLAVGDKILSASGTYDYTTNTLTVSTLSVYQNPGVFVWQNFQGTLKSLSGPALPATLVLTIGSTDYTVSLPATARIYNNARGLTQLARFQAGDTVRVYGAISKTDLSAIDAIVARDVNF